MCTPCWPTGVSAGGYREILSLHVTSTENGAGWLAFFRDLMVHSVPGVALVRCALCRAVPRA